jgi:hypothetical protein
MVPHLAYDLLPRATEQVSIRQSDLMAIGLPLALASFEELQLAWIDQRPFDTVDLSLNLGKETIDRVRRDLEFVQAGLPRGETTVVFL